MRRAATRPIGFSIVGLVAVVTLLVAAPVDAKAKASVDRTLKDSEIIESSGISHSTYDSSILFTHNDSGDTNRIFAIDKSGATKATLTISGAEAEDWEDISAGPNHTQWIADIGDNDEEREVVTVYRITEPQNLTTSKVKATKFDFKYPDGAANAETLMVHPQTGRVFIVTKNKKGGVLYEAPAKLSSTSANMLKKVGTGPKTATGGTFFPDGKQFVVRTKTTAYLYSKVGAKPKVLKLPIKEGESIEVTADGTALLLGTEGENSKVYRMPIAVKRPVAQS